MNVPFLDLKTQYAALSNEIQPAIQEVLQNTAFSGGPFVAAFEDEFAAFCGSRHAIGVGSGTDALWLSLLALGIGPGDEVITVPNTFIATAEAITYCGATPVFVDIEEDTYTMNPALLAEAITPATRAIIPVHIFGQCADMDAIMAIARERGLSIIEDACQAHGAEYKGRKAGSIGDMGCFSFYPGKNLGAYGEAGAIITNNDVLAEKMKMIRDHGQAKKYYHATIGWNARMDGIQGAILSIKLKHLQSWNENRRSHAETYARTLAASRDLIKPLEGASARHVYHIYAIRTKKRDQLMTHLTERGVTCGIHYPVPVHLQDAYQCLNLKKGDFPVAERCAEELLSLPMYPELTSEQIRYVAESVNAFIGDEKNDGQPVD